jgi:putative transcriptional regulator
MNSLPMPAPRQWRAITGRLLALAALLLVLPLAGAATTDLGAPGGSLKGQLLVAAPEMDDPRFAHAVILMVQHDQTGALGIIINRPVGKISFADLLKSVGQPGPAVPGELWIFAGGPVELNGGFVLHSPEYHRAETQAIDGQLAVTSSPEVLRDIAEAKGPKKSLVAFGYAGWGPGQLESELMRHDWFTEAEDPALVFDDDRARVWKDAMARRSQAL